MIILGAKNCLEQFSIHLSVICLIFVRNVFIFLSCLEFDKNHQNKDKSFKIPDKIASLLLSLKLTYDVICP